MADKLDDKVLSCIEFLRIVGNLKHLKRTGWVKRKIEEPETVASHMYRMALMGFMIPDECQVNKNKVIKMALVHDLAEALVGDITPYCGVSNTDKYTMEKNGLMEMLSNLPNKNMVEEMMDLWEEYELAETTEAKFVKDFDKFDMILQAHEYESSQSNIGEKGLQEFFSSTEGIFRTDMVKSWDVALRSQRDNKQNLN